MERGNIEERMETVIEEKKNKIIFKNKSINKDKFVIVFFIQSDLRSLSSSTNHIEQCFKLRLIGKSKKMPAKKT